MTGSEEGKMFRGEDVYHTHVQYCCGHKTQRARIRKVVFVCVCERVCVCVDGCTGMQGEEKGCVKGTALGE